jgi:SAM-dependent methyltransferase
MKATRGNGVLENFLARQRAKLTDRLIPLDKRSGRILDIGCGTYPYFLNSVRFDEKYGIDKNVIHDANHQGKQEIFIKHHDMELEGTIPYQDNYFDVVTMLAVFEHIETSLLTEVLREVRRILKPEGCLILTTPAVWTDPLLRFLSRIGVLSAEEIDEHKDRYNHDKVRNYLLQSGFNQETIHYGYFEVFMNLWVMAHK